MKRDASFVIVHAETGKALMETFDRKLASDLAKTGKYKSVPILDYLEELNAQVQP